MPKILTKLQPMGQQTPGGHLNRTALVSGAGFPNGNGGFGYETPGQYVPVKTPGLADPNYTEAGSVDGSGSSSESILQQMLNRLLNRTSSEVSPFPDYVGSKLTPEQRAAQLVASKYSGKTAALGRAQNQVAQNLAAGVATQNSYGTIGDAKLKTIYENLTNVAKDTATKTDALYAGAKTGVDATYADAVKAQAGVAAQTQGDVADVASKYGLQAAVGEATKHLTAYQSGAQSQLATDRAAGVSNIITLGANMGAAALKDVNIMAQLGADSRRDLISSVQGTIAQLQQQAAAQQADLQSQLLELEDARAADMQNATYQYQVDEAEKKSSYAMEKLKYEFENKKFQAEAERTNMQDILDILGKQNDEITTKASIKAAGISATLASRKQDSQEARDFAEYGIKVNKQALDEKQFGLDAANTSFDNNLAATRLQFDVRKTAIDDARQAAQNTFEKTKFATTEARLTAQDKITNQFKTDSAKLAADKAANDAVTAKAKTADKITSDAAKATAEKDKTELRRLQIEKAKEDIKTAKAKVTSKKYSKGAAGANDYATELNKKIKGMGTNARGVVNQIVTDITNVPNYGDKTPVYDKVIAGIIDKYSTNGVLTTNPLELAKYEAAIKFASIQYNKY